LINFLKKKSYLQGLQASISATLGSTKKTLQFLFVPMSVSASFSKEKNFGPKEQRC
tara:strand:- start:56 stop:223 length:168 start_codon:yes stop_codon:yes gene_type:complete